MPREFNVPQYYRSSGIGAIKRFRRSQDPRRKDFTPTTVDFGQVRFHIARHFGFCFGVENAIEIAYRAIEENPDRRIFLLSEMIHNPGVNADLEQRGVQFLMDTAGNAKIPFSELLPDDVVIVPAFGTTLELQAALEEKGIDPYQYDTTCPFVEKVWKRSADLGREGFAVIVHGKRKHEETRATFSHSQSTAPTLVIRDLEDAEFIARFIAGDEDTPTFWERFEHCASENFNPEEHLHRVGVVNQTTMLATETIAISETIREALRSKYGADALAEHFADTRDTLCYATHENQSATRALIERGADIAIVVGGYNSSNTSHLVELCEEHMPTYYVKDAGEILSAEAIRHYEINQKRTIETSSWLPEQRPLDVAITSGASCPDASVDEVIRHVAGLIESERSFEEAFQPFHQSIEAAPR